MEQKNPLPNIPGSSETPVTPQINSSSLKKPFSIVLLVVLLVVLSSLGTYFFVKSQPPSQIPVVSPTPTNSASLIPPTTDETANWKTYTNTVQNYSFKYSSDWNINSGQANEQQNSLLELTRNQERMIIYANLYGIGGVGRDYQGTSVNIGGINLYEYKAIGADGNTQTLGVTDSLKQSLGVFKVNDKTYQITLTYPTGYDQTDKGMVLKKEFNQILSTFRFTGQNQADPTANWKTYNSSCRFNIKYPADWIAQKYFIKDSDASCSYITAPDYKQGLDSREGLNINISRTTIGSISNTITINSLDDYILSLEKTSEPPTLPKNMLDKTYGGYQGKQFDLAFFESSTIFAFINGKYIYSIAWPSTYTGAYKNFVDQILSTFKFL